MFILLHDGSLGRYQIMVHMSPVFRRKNAKIITFSNRLAHTHDTEPLFYILSIYMYTK